MKVTKHIEKESKEYNFKLWEYHTYTKNTGFEIYFIITDYNENFIFKTNNYINAIAFLNEYVKQEKAV